MDGSPELSTFRSWGQEEEPEGTLQRTSQSGKGRRGEVVQNLSKNCFKRKKLSSESKAADN